MNIILVTPADRRSRAGNRATATRWAGFLRELGHRVRVVLAYDGQAVDLMIALHAWRSAESVRRFHDEHPGKPLLLAMTGTDIYKFQYTHPATTLASMDLAHGLIGLHDRVGDDLPAKYRGRLHTVFQSALPLPGRKPPVRSRFDVCVIGHLREEKDSLRAAFAVRALPAASRLRVIQLGKAHNAEWEQAAREEMTLNPRYHWRGEVPRGEVRRLMARARLMVMSSVMEGGANVVSEACVAGLPVIASDIPGNRGLLGDDYPGYYPTADTAALRACLLRAEGDPAFVEQLQSHCLARAPLFRPETERDALQGVIAQVTGHRVRA